jgi:hypothetical protein
MCPEDSILWRGLVRVASEKSGCAADDIEGVSREKYWRGYDLRPAQTCGLALGSLV